MSGNFLVDPILESGLGHLSMKKSSSIHLVQIYSTRAYYSLSKVKISQNFVAYSEYMNSTNIFRMTHIWSTFNLFNTRKSGHLRGTILLPLE